LRTGAGTHTAIEKKAADVLRKTKRQEIIMSHVLPIAA
jgi:hypothetical protein